MWSGFLTALYPPGANGAFFGLVHMWRVACEGGLLKLLILLISFCLLFGKLRCQRPISTYPYDPSSLFYPAGLLPLLNSNPGAYIHNNTVSETISHLLLLRWLIVHYTPSSMVTLRHQGFSPVSANISSASPTCLLSLTSLLTCPLNLSRMAFSARKLFAPPLPPLPPPRVSPRDADPDPERISSLETQPPSLVTGSCYWRGSEEEESRFKCR